MSFIQDVFEIKDRVDSKINEPQLDLSFRGESQEIAITEDERTGAMIATTGTETVGTKYIDMSVYLICSNIGGSQAPRCKTKFRISTNGGSERYRLGWLPRNRREDIEPVLDPVHIDPADYREIELFRFTKTTNLDESEVKDTEVKMPMASEEIELIENQSIRLTIQTVSSEGDSDTLEFDFDWNGEVSKESIRSAISFVEE